MILKSQNKRIEISSALLNDVYDPSNKSVTIVGKKNCCAEFLNKVLVVTDLVNQSIVSIKDNYYHPFAVAGRLFEILLVNTNTNGNYAFQPAGNLNLNNANDVTLLQIAFISFVSSVPDLQLVTLSVTNKSGYIEIIINNLPSHIKLESCHLKTDTGSSYFGEIISSPVFYPYNYIEDGIYDFTIKSLDLNTNSFVSESKCIGILDDIKCLIPNNIINNKNSISHLIYQSIMNVNDCNCICEDMCNLYNSLIEEVKWT